MPTTQIRINKHMMRGMCMLQDLYGKSKLFSCEPLLFNAKPVVLCCTTKEMAV